MNPDIQRLVASAQALQEENARLRKALSDYAVLVPVGSTVPGEVTTQLGRFPIERMHLPSAEVVFVKTLPGDDGTLLARHIIETLRGLGEGDLAPTIYVSTPIDQPVEIERFWLMPASLDEAMPAPAEDEGDDAVVEDLYDASDDDDEPGQEAAAG